MPGKISHGQFNSYWAQWGDEGKGKIVDLLTAHSTLLRAIKGHNAGHTVIIKGRKYVFTWFPQEYFIRKNYV